MVLLIPKQFSERYRRKDMSEIEYIITPKYQQKFMSKPCIDFKQVALLFYFE
jgi:hypothetical protein